MWELIIQLWKNRNKQVHDREGKSIHTIEQDHLDKAITFEWDKGISNLSNQYENLFNSSIEQRLMDTADRKGNGLHQFGQLEKDRMETTNLKIQRIQHFTGMNHGKKETSYF